MPFDYAAYQQKCNGLSTEQLHKEWENYTRQIAGGATSTATSVLFSPVTGGVSLIGLGLSAPRIHNARKKREIIEAGLRARGETHSTRKRDVIAPMALAGTISGLTLGLAGPGAEMIGGVAAEKGAEYVASHAALEGTGALLEHKHDKHSHHKAHEKLKVQYQNFEKQHAEEQAKLQGGQQQIVDQQSVMRQPQMISYQPSMYAPQPPYQIPHTLQEIGNQQAQYQLPLGFAQDQKHTCMQQPMQVPTPAPEYSGPLYPPGTHQPRFIPQTQLQDPNTTKDGPQYYQTQQNSTPTSQPSTQTSTVSNNSAFGAGYHPPEKQGATCPVPKPESQGFPPSYSEPLPVYSQPGISSPPYHYQIASIPSTPEITISELPAEVGVSKGVEVNTATESAIEQEINMLKARLLQKELEKLQVAVQPVEAFSTPVQNTSLSTTTATANANTKTTAQNMNELDSDQLHIVSPLPSPYPSYATQSLPAPIAQNTNLVSPISSPPPGYNDIVQNQQAPIAQQQQQAYPPKLQHHDSGYYSQPATPQAYMAPPPPPQQQQHQQQQYQQPPPPSPMPSQFRNPTYNPLLYQPPPSPSPLSPQSTNATYNPTYYQPKPQTLSPTSPPSTNTNTIYNPSQDQHSVSSIPSYPQQIHTPIPTPAPQMYFPPPPGTIAVVALAAATTNPDYFAMQRGSTPQPTTHATQAVYHYQQPQQQYQDQQPVQAQQSRQGMQWQWGTVQQPQQQYHTQQYPQ